MSFFRKDPAATLDYAVDWSDWLTNDTIASATWVVPDGLTVEAQTNTTTSATVWVSGGALGETYALVNQVTTAGGRVDERTLTIEVRNK